MCKLMINKVWMNALDVLLLLTGDEAHSTEKNKWENKKKERKTE